MRVATSQKTGHPASVTPQPSGESGVTQEPRDMLLRAIREILVQCRGFSSLHPSITPQIQRMVLAGFTGNKASAVSVAPGVHVKGSFLVPTGGGPPVAHYFFPNGYGVIVEQVDAERFTLLPFEFGAFGRLETLSPSARNAITGGGPSCLDHGGAAELILSVAVLPSSRDAPYKPPERDRPQRWHKIDLDLLKVIA